MKTTLDQLAVIERRDAWIRRLSQLFFAALFALLLTGAVVGGIAFILNQREATQRDSRAAATKRIDGLQATINEQATKIEDLSGRLGTLTAGQEALRTQLLQNGLIPVVQQVRVVSPQPTKTADPTPGPTTNPRPSPSTSARPRPSASPSPSPSPSRCTVLDRLTGRCVTG